VRKLLATRAGVPPGGCALSLSLSLSLSCGGLFAFAFWPFGKLLNMVMGFVCFAFVFGGSFFFCFFFFFPGCRAQKFFFRRARRRKEEVPADPKKGPTRRTLPANVNLVCFFV